LALVFWHKYRDGSGTYATLVLMTMAPMSPDH
jgi:hypothetical protein